MKVIVTTTINPPTKAIRYFDGLDDWHLVVVGDKKTPEPYEIRRGTYLSPEDQEKIDPELSDAIGWNCIQRRNFGFLVALDMGAEIVATIDDDNIPYDNWGTSLLVGQEIDVPQFQTDLAVFDPVGATNYPHLWHRGYPIQLIPHRDYGSVAPAKIRPTVQADFWNGDPDVDAICRMEHAPNCVFDPSRFPFAASATSPFNSQNTFLLNEVLPHYFLFPAIGRMDDIWAAYYAQAVGAAKPVFCAPSVTQDRNEHDPIVDMRQEYLGYEKNLELVEALIENPESVVRFLPEQAWRAFELYRKHF